MQLVWPSTDTLPGYVQALERGWSPNTLRVEAGQEELAEQTAGAILKLCVRIGGSITGEHGVGADKASYMGDMFSDDDLATMNMVRCSFDPETRFNPGKVFPTPRLCGDKSRR